MRFIPRAGHRQQALACLAVVGVVSTAMLGTHGAAAAVQQRVSEVAAAAHGLATGKKMPTPLARAQAALVAAKLRLAQRQYAKALISLKGLRDNLTRAHGAGMAQIGKPPKNPESDEPPGPAAVIAVLNLEHRVMVEVPPLLNGMKTGAVVQSLRYTLLKTHRLRNAMLRRVVALPAEGAGADYDDDMSDAVDSYTSEVNLITAALEQYELTPAARVGLTNALVRARATETMVVAKWGGGE